jgi:hypothetical protein
MKLLKYFLLTGYILSAQWSFSQQSEVRVTEPFNKIDVDNKIIVQLIKSDEESLEVKAQEIEVQRVMSTVTDNVLKLYIGVPPYKYGKVRVILKFRQLDEIEVSGMAEVSSETLFKADTLYVTAKGGGKVYLDLDVKHLESKMSEGGLISAEGYAVSQNVYVATGGALSAFNLESDIVDVKAVTGGTAKINVSKELTGQVTTGGYIGYKGEPEKIETKVYSGGKVVKFEE